MSEKETGTPSIPMSLPAYAFLREKGAFENRPEPYAEFDLKNIHEDCTGD